MSPAARHPCQPKKTGAWEKGGKGRARTGGGGAFADHVDDNPCRKMSRPFEE